MPAGTLVAPVSPALGRLVFALLQPRSDDGVVSWNLLDEQIEVDSIYPGGTAAGAVSAGRAKLQGAHEPAFMSNRGRSAGVAASAEAAGPPAHGSNGRSVTRHCAPVTNSANSDHAPGRPWMGTIVSTSSPRRSTFR